MRLAISRKGDDGFYRRLHFVDALCFDEAPLMASDFT